MVTCFHCHQQTPESEYARTVHNKTPLYGPWSGWRMAGRFLVAPGHERITPERLRGILWAESNRRPNSRKLAAIIARKTCLPPRELFRGQA
jgi:hypothetical protein